MAKKMKAYRMIEWGRKPEFADVAVPVPGAGEVLIRMKGAGLCRSDLDIMEQQPAAAPYACVLPGNFTLGHENAGVVEAVGPGVTDLVEGDGVAVHHMHSCGHCDFCLHGVEQSCGTYARGAVSLTRGVGIDGGLAEFLCVARHELVPLGTLDPVRVAPLTDAGVTAYRAVQHTLDSLRPGSTAVVIGLGGLGIYGVQFLKLLSAANIIALDISPQRLAMAQEVGADHVAAPGAQTDEWIMDLTRGRGADGVIDFVGSNDTLALAAKVSRPQGKVVLVGMEGGALHGGWGGIATNCGFVISMGSTRADLSAVCQLAAQDKLRIDLETFPLDQIELAYERLRQGKLNGRAVITFDS